MIGIDSEPDDFEIQANQDATAYVEAQRLETERERIKSDNKKRRQQGLPVETVPRRPKRPRAPPGRQTHSGAESGSDDGSTSVKKGHASFSYEGQVVLDYNPLYRLAGLDEGESTSSRLTHAKQRVLENLSGRQLLYSTGTSRGSGSDIGPDDSNGDRGAMDDPNSDTSPRLAEVIALSGDEEDYVEDDGDVMVPWGSAATIPAKTIAKDDPTEEEGVYSEDEQPATLETARPSHAGRLPRDAECDTSLPPWRPNFGGDPPSPAGFHELGSGASVPAPINRHLRHYQREGASFLYDKYKAGIGGVLGDDMGLGKTIQVISFLSAIMRKTGTVEDHGRRKRHIRASHEGCLNPKHWPTALIVCPKSLISNWERELNTWGYFEYREWRSDSLEDTKRAFLHGFLDIIIATYDAVRSSIEDLKLLPISVVIADEAHRLKDPKGQLALAMKKFSSPSCFALTGTLIQNRLDEMWSILDFVHRGEAGTIDQWREFTVNPIKRGQRHEGMASDVVASILRLGVMHRKVLPHFSLRRTKKLIAAELPTKRDLVVFCPMASRQVKAYRAFIQSEDVQFVTLRDEACQCGSGKARKLCCHAHNADGETVKEVLLRSISSAIKISNHFGLLYPAPDDSDKTLNINRRLYRICTGADYGDRLGNAYEAAIDPENCGKWTLLRELLEDWRREEVDNKILIFSNTVRLLKMIDEFITANFSGFDHDLLTGEVDGNRRQEMVDAFQDRGLDHFVLLISTQAGGVGLNLTAANKVVIFDPSWNPAHDLQAMDRAFRIGQKRPVDVYRLIGQGTIEENIYERQIQKEQRSRQLNEGTFERRIHQGVDKARGKEEQGELFGVQNLFRFDPKGTVSNNLNRVRLAEDRFLQDMIDAQYGSDDDEGSDDEVAHRTKMDRQRQDKQRAHLKSRAQSDQQLASDLLDNRPTDDQVDRKLEALRVQGHDHATAFKDSPEERAMFEIGLQLLHSNPELAKSIKANDLGKYARRAKVTSTQPTRRASAGRKWQEEPWEERLSRRQQEVSRDRQLAVLSEDEE